jgi:hypothetical protein
MLVKFWSYFNGKKRVIALIYWSVLIPSMTVIWPNGYPEGFPLAFSKGVAIFGFLLSAIGLGHAAVKSRSSKNSTEEEEIDDGTSQEDSKSNP